MQQSFCKHALNPSTPDSHKPVVATTSPRPKLTPEQADCGPRALKIALDKLGKSSELSVLRKTAGTTGYGTTMDGLKHAAEAAGVKAEGVQMDRVALLKFDGPAIAWVEGDHYVTLLERQGEDFRVRDPSASKEVEISVDDVLRRSGGVILKLSRK